MPFDIAESQNEDGSSNFFLDNRELFTNISQVAGKLNGLSQKDSESFVSIMNFLQVQTQGDHG